MAGRWVLLGGLTLLCACGGAMLPQLTPAQVAWAGRQWSDMGATRLAEARLLYVKRCSGCHNLFLPAAKDPEEWQKILPKMAERAKLTELQREEIWRYLQTARALPTGDLPR